MSEIVSKLFQMKVLSIPEPKKGWTTTVTCEGKQGVRLGCGTSLEINEDDLFRVDRATVPGVSPDPRITKCISVACVQCPTCKAWSDVDDYPQADVLPDYGMWRYINAQPNQKLDDPRTTADRLLPIMTKPAMDIELPGYYSAPPPSVRRTVPQDLDARDNNHLRAFKNGKYQNIGTP